MAVNWSKELIDQLDWHWTNLFLPRMAGLTDEEYFWEPARGCWSVRRQADGRWMVDFQIPQPDPPPVTTIAWRVCHIGGGVLANRNAKHFGAGPFDVRTRAYPATAKDALDWIEREYATWKAGVLALDDEGLARTVGDKEPFDLPMAALVLHINREFIHHAAEVALLRDLYRARFGAT
ncbi:MAG TPA: DinB family protein [Chloroflexota bacterium]|nr:DinB family protein [Chloroflexota bacterium]